MPKASEWVVPRSQLRDYPSVPYWIQPHWGKLIENIDRIEGLACEACYKTAMQSKKLQRYMSEMDVLVEQLAARQRAYLGDYEDQVVLDQEEARRDFAEYVNDNRLRKDDVL